MTTTDPSTPERSGIELVTELVASDLCLVGRCSQLSRGGLSTQIARPLTPGSTCDVRVSLVFSANHRSEALPLRGVVAWCTPLRDVYQLGVRFHSPDEQQAAYLDLFIGIVDDGELADLGA